MKKRIFLGAAVLFAAGIFASAVGPADLGDLSGSVLGDDMETPLAGAVVRVVNVADGQEYLSPPSSANGRFELAGVAEGRYAVTVIAGGSSYTLRDRLYVKGRERADLRLGLGANGATSQEAGEVVADVEMGRIVLSCVKPPKPPKPPKSKHNNGNHYAYGHEKD